MLEKNNLMYVYEIDAQIKNESQILKKNLKDVLITPNETYKTPPHGIKPLKNIIIVGSGPAGLFAGYMLAKKGYYPIIRKSEDIR